MPVVKLTRNATTIMWMNDTSLIVTQQTTTDSPMAVAPTRYAYCVKVHPITTTQNIYRPKALSD